MQVKKITAKIRDMVKVSLMENDDERAWYNNIEMPDEIKELEMKDFGFRTMQDGKIEFQITFEPGILPKTFPEKKARKRRNAPDAMAPKLAATPAPIMDTKPAAAPMKKDDAKSPAKIDSAATVPPTPVASPKATGKKRS